MKRTRIFSIAGIVLALMLVAVPVFAADPNPGRGNTDVVIQNTANAAASAKAIYYDEQGNIDAELPKPLASRGSFVFKAADVPALGDGWRGSMTVQSDTELAAVAEIKWTDGSSAHRTRGAAYTGYASGASEMYLPFAVWSKDCPVHPVHGAEHGRPAGQHRDQVRGPQRRHEHRQDRSIAAVRVQDIQHEYVQRWCAGLHDYHVLAE